MTRGSELSYQWAPECTERPARERAQIRGIVVHRIQVSQEDPSYGDGPSEIMRFFREHPIGREATGGAMPYAIIIEPNGHVTQCVPLDRVAPHARAHNPTTVGVACVGDFRSVPPTEAQHRTLIEVCVALTGELGLSADDIKGHDELAGASRDASKECPGRFLPLDAVRADVKQAALGARTKLPFRWALPRGAARARRWLSRSVALLFAVVAAATVVGVVHWLSRRESVRLGRSVALESIGAELFYLSMGGLARRGPDRLMVLRFVRPPELVPRHFRADGLPQPLAVEGWRDHLGAAVVVNAGQFDEAQNHLGWLKSNDRWLAERAKSGWLGLLVSGPHEGPPWSGIIDLDTSNRDIVDRYRHAVQSMMLVDEQGRVRVRDSERAACRTVVAQDRAGHLLFILTEGAVVLGDLARHLAESPLDIVRAMNLDGGLESQLVVHTPELELVHYGQFGIGSSPLEAGPGELHWPLPAVIAVMPAAPHADH